MTDHLPLRQLAVLVAVIRHGGFRAAGRALNVTQAAISQSLRQLEDHLGMRLLDRSTRPATLTRAGQLLYDATRDSLARIATAMEEVRTLARDEDASTVTLASSVGVATYWLMPRLAVVTAALPEVAINVMTTHQGAPSLAPGVDLALRFGDGAWTDGIVMPLFDEEICPVASPRLIGSGVAWQEAPSLHVETDDPAWIGWPAYLRRAGLPPSRTRALRFTNYVQATQAALNGQGVMLGWRSITGDLEAEGRLVRVGPAIPSADGFHLVQAAGAPKASVLQDIARLLKDSLRHGDDRSPIL